MGWESSTKVEVTLDYFFTVIKGGPNSGHHGHVGIPGTRGGSATSKFGQFAAILNSAPIGKASLSTKWRKQHQELYDTDEDFRALCDTVAIYTQGGFKITRAMSQYAVTGEIPEEWKDSIVPNWVKDNFSMSALTPAFGDIKGFFKGQENINDFEKEALGYKSALEASAILQSTIASSQPLTQPIFRGAQGSRFRDAQGEIQVGRVPKVGEDVDIMGTSSFTASKEIATDFAQGTSRGNKRDISSAPYAILYEIAPGAKGINVSSLSPWNQEEILTSGRFKVKEVIPYETDIYNNSRIYARRIPGYHVIMEQTGAWEVDPADYAGKPIKTSYVK